VRCSAARLRSRPISPRTVHHLAEKNFARVLYQTGSKRGVRLKDVPMFNELMDKHNTSAPVRQLVKIINASDEFGRPIVAPPGVPPDKMKILRDAFNKEVNDPTLLAEAEKRRLDRNPSTEAELDSLIKDAMTAPPAIVEKVKSLIGR
jgi:hypothetical protein